MAEKKIRLQFDFSADQVKRLDEITKKMSSVTRAATVRKAVWFLGWAIDKLEKGESVTLPSNSVELICTVWPVAKE